MTESRSQTRAGCLVHGQISAPELDAPIDCTIWDISHAGARLILPDGASLPDRIKISTLFSLQPRNAEVCWRAGGEVGIRLLPDESSSAEGELLDQVRAAEEINAELVQRLRDMQRQLEAAEARMTAKAPEGAALGLPAQRNTADRDRAFTYVLDDEARILVTDDDPILREFARVHLTTPSAAVEVAESAEQGLECLAKGQFDIALIDLEMPGMGGLEMIRRLRDDPRHGDLPIVVVTGRDDMGSIDLAYEAGATSFVTKPVNWRLMSYQLRYVLRAQRMYRARVVPSKELALAG
ncbi:MAG: response regulator [Methylobacteriaceae bacterium]|nr:response regulator [Methylobacteriaceae bacterium]